MYELKHHIIENSSFPVTEHRISLVQVGVSLTAFLPDGSPSKLCESDDYLSKLQRALSLALQDNWANFVVFPEISVPLNSLSELMRLSCRIVKDRAEDAGGCIVCLPLEHLSLSRLSELIEALSSCPDFTPGDRVPDNSNALDHLFNSVPPADECLAFVNVAILLAFTKSGTDARAHYFIQPKLFPFPQERTLRSGRFVAGRKTYLLEIGGIKVMTAICFDLIAQPIGKSLFLGDIFEAVCTQYGSLDYLLIPQCNDAPLDNNFQRALVDLYHRNQRQSQTLRVISPNVAHITIHDNSVEAGQSWVVTCPFGSELPPIGIWEKNLVSVLKDPSTAKTLCDAPSLGQYAQRLRLAAKGEWFVHLSLPPAKALSEFKGPNAPLVPHTGRIYEWDHGQWREKPPLLFVRECWYAERLPGLQVLDDLGEWVQENMGGRNTYSPSYSEFTSHSVSLPQSDHDTVSATLRMSKDVWVRGRRACGKSVFGLGIAFEWIWNASGRCLFLDLKDLDVERAQFLDLSRGDIEWFLISVQKPLLVILDNVHIQESLASKLLKQVQTLRRSGKPIQMLLLGQLADAQRSERVTLLDNESLVNHDLVATEEAFICVAERLTKKSGIRLETDVNLPNKWLKECGGDLAIFAAAFDPTRPAQLDRASISLKVRERYLIPSESQLGRRSAFFDICLLSSLDLGVQDAIIWEQTAETLFPEFVHQGIVLRVPIRTGTSRVYHRLFHPSLGDLILNVATNFNKEAYRSLWLDKALDLCHRDSFLAVMIQSRLASGHYRDVMEFDSWCGVLRKEDGLIDRAVCRAPYRKIIKSFRKLGLAWTWERILSRPDSKGYAVLIETLESKGFRFIALFLKDLDRQGFKNETLGVIEALYARQEFRTRLKERPVDVAGLWQYLQERGMTGRSEELLNTLLKTSKFSVESFISQPIIDQAALFESLRQFDNRKVAQAVLDATWGQMDDATFQEGISSLTPQTAGLLQKAIMDSRLALKPELWQILVRKAYGS